MHSPQEEDAADAALLAPEDKALAKEGDLAVAECVIEEIGNPTAKEQGNLVYVYQECPETGVLQVKDKYVHKEDFDDAGVATTPLAHVCFTAGLLVTAVVAAMYLQAVMVIWSIMGATVCFLVAFVLPSLYYLKLGRVTNTFWGRLRRRGAMVLLFISLCSCLLCTVVTVMKVVKGTNPCPKWG